jgi:hypothetical protein
MFLIVQPVTFFNHARHVLLVIQEGHNQLPKTECENRKHEMQGGYAQFASKKRYEPSKEQVGPTETIKPLFHQPSGWIE